MQIFDDIIDNLTGYYNDLVIFLPKLIVGLLVISLFWWLGGRSKRMIKSKWKDSVDDPLMKDFVAQLVKIIWIAIGFLVFLKIIGWEDIASSIMATAGVSAFIVGFAFKDIGENFLAGIVMAFKRPFRMGDIIETNGIVGKITTMSLRDTLVKTFDGKDVYIPNGLILKSPLRNYTIDGYLRYDFDLRLDFDTDFFKASRIVLDELKSIKGILKDERPPDVTVEGLENEVVILKVYFWVNTFDPGTSVFKIKTEAYHKCISALSKAGIHLPHQVIDIHSLPENTLS